MPEDPKLVVALIGAITGVVLGFMLSELKAWLWRIKGRRAHWRALSAEAELCREMAERLLQDNVQAPLYRLPTLAYLHSFPALLADGVASDRETRAVTQFYNQVETLNRGLDQANDALDDEQKLSAEFGRNRIKAAQLVGTVSYYTTVRQVLDQRTN